VGWVVLGWVLVVVFPPGYKYSLLCPLRLMKMILLHRLQLQLLVLLLQEGVVLQEVQEMQEGVRREVGREVGRDRWVVVDSRSLRVMCIRIRLMDILDRWVVIGFVYFTTPFFFRIVSRASCAPSPTFQ
jgi:hypothetical protein